MQNTFKYEPWFLILIAFLAIITVTQTMEDRAITLCTCNEAKIFPFTRMGMSSIFSACMNGILLCGQKIFNEKKEAPQVK